MNVARRFTDKTADQQLAFFDGRVALQAAPLIEPYHAWQRWRWRRRLPWIGADIGSALRVQA